MSTESVNEMVVVDDSTAPSLANQFDIVDVESAKAFMDNYQELVEALLDDTDYQKIQGKNAKKKSAWRKLATAFNISDEIVHHEETRDETGQIVSAKFFVKATLPNGRSSIGVGECSIYGKIRYKATAKFPADKDTPSNFELRGRYSDAEHDVPATAHTRAKSRAIADLIGAGEVSAEELSGLGVKPKKPVKPSKPNAPKPTKLKTTANLSNKPKTPTKPKASPKKEEEAIEVEAKEVKQEPSENPAIKMAVSEIQGQGGNPDKSHVLDKLLDLLDMGKITSDEYHEAKKLME